MDRKHDMICSGGKNIYPREIEEVIYTHEAVLEAAVIGIPSRILGRIRQGARGLERRNGRD